jgi:polysaccharide deacetylase 2 family uncharacterized protein YibQ
LDDHEIEEYQVLAEQKKLHRERKLRNKKIRALSVWAFIALLIVAAILFTPIGPFGHLLFPDSKAASVDETSNPPPGPPPPSGPEGQPGQKAEAEVANSTRIEKASDPTGPTIAIIVDDTGNSTENLGQWLNIDAPITFAAIPHYAASAQLSDTLYGAGFQIMLHIPTENDPPKSYSGNGQLSVGMSRETVFGTLDGDLAVVPHIEGINNHQGGRGCNDLQLMIYECQWAQGRGFFVVDSDSSTHSQVTQAATSLGMPKRRSQVFIDHDNDPNYIRSAMRHLADIARKYGTAIGICHFHRPNTPRTVGEMINTLRAEGIHFAFVQDISN